MFPTLPAAFPDQNWPIRNKAWWKTKKCKNELIWKKIPCIYTYTIGKCILKSILWTFGFSILCIKMGQSWKKWIFNVIGIHPICVVWAVILNLWIILHVLDVFSVLHSWIELIPFALSQASGATSLDYPQHIIPITLKIHFFQLWPIFRVLGQARFWWNSDFPYIYPIYDTQRTIGNRE